MSKVTSKDGTTIAYDKKGSGPAVILVDGALCYRSFGPMGGLSELLAPNFTVFTFDRRGRGESSNSKPYKIDREVEDLEALIQEAGGQAFLFGTSSGGCLVLETAIRLDDQVKKLAIYEAPYIPDKNGSRAWKVYRHSLDKALKEGRNGDAVMLFMQLVGTPADQVGGMKQSPVWPLFEAVAPTLAYDAAAMGDDRVVPVRRATSVHSPALVMNGTITPALPESAAMLTEAMSNAEHRTLEGQPHDVNLNVLASALTPFFLQ